MKQINDTVQCITIYFSARKNAVECLNKLLPKCGELTDRVKKQISKIEAIIKYICSPKDNKCDEHQKDDCILDYMFVGHWFWNLQRTYLCYDQDY